MLFRGLIPKVYCEPLNDKSMSGIKKNFAYNTFLTVSERLINLLLFPYCARILGVEKFGTVNYVQTVVQYFSFFAVMGIVTVGAREIAKQRDQQGLNECFSAMIVLTVVFTSMTLAVYMPLIFLVDKFANYEDLYLLGGLQIIFSSFCIEWFFRGTENFKYITIRSLGVRVLYVILVLCLVRESSDYKIFFALSVWMIVMNTIVNYWYARKFVKFTFSGLKPFKYLKSTLSLGMYSILTSMYTTVNVVYLGYVWGDVQVGLYTTAIKVYIIVLGFYSAFTGVMLPRMSSVIESHDVTMFNNLIEKSLELMYMMTLPMVFFLLVMAPEIIYILAGVDFMPAADLSRIVIPMLFVVGLAQVLSFQIIIPSGYDKLSFNAALIGAIIGVLFNFWLTTNFSALGTCVTVVITEIVVTSYYLYVVTSKKLYKFDALLLLRNLLYSIPYLFICILVKQFSDNPIVNLVLASVASMIYFMFSQLYLIKNEQFLMLMTQMGIIKSNRK